MQTPTPLVQETGVAGVAIVPSVKRRTAFHGRENMHPARMTTPFFEDLLDSLFLTKALVRANEFDFQTGLLSEAPRMAANLIAQDLGPVGIIAPSNALSREEPRYGFGVTNIRQSSGDHDPVETREDPCDLLPVALNKRVLRDLSPRGCS